MTTRPSEKFGTSRRKIREQYGNCGLVMKMLFRVYIPWFVSRLYTIHTPQQSVLQSPR